MHIRSCLAVFLFFCLSSLSFSQTIPLDSVIVTATRTSQEVSQVPANVTVISKKEIENSQAKTVPDLLRGQEGLVVRDYTGTGKNVTVDLRSFGETAANNTLVLVDGRRVNAIDLSGTDWTLIPIEQIERIEIVRGSGSVLYGDNAVGGVINIITKSPGQGVALTAHGDAGSYNLHKENLLVSAGSNVIAGMFSVGNAEIDGYRDNAYLDAKNWSGQLSFFPLMGNLEMKLTGGGHSDEYGMPGALDKNAMRQDRRAAKNADDYAETNDHYWQWSAEYDANEAGTFLVDMGWRNRNVQSYFFSAIYGDSESKSDLETLSFSPRYEVNLPIGDFDNQLIVGGDLYQHELDVDSTYSLGDVDRDSIGVFLHDEIFVSNNLNISAGFRHEHVKFDLNQVDRMGMLSPLDDSTSSDEQAWEVGVVYLFTPETSAFARVNKSFRIPLADEMIVYDYSNGEQVINPDLKTQTGAHVEVGVRSEMTSRLSCRLTLFQARIDDEIFYNPLTFSNENHPETLRRGVEAGANFHITDMISLAGTYTFTNAEFVEDPFDGNKIPGVPEQMGNLTLSVHNIVPGLYSSVAYNYVGSSYAISDQANNWEKVESYGTVDLNISYKRDQLKLFASIKNLFDEKYSEWVVSNSLGLNYYPAAERNFVVGVELAF